MPCEARYSQIAWVVAAMWSSLNVAVNAEPRWPEVPNDTRWAASSGSGCTAKNAVTSFGTSTRSLGAAGWPARGLVTLSPGQLRRARPWQPHPPGSWQFGQRRVAASAVLGPCHLRGAGRQVGAQYRLVVIAGPAHHDARPLSRAGEVALEGLLSTPRSP